MLTPITQLLPGLHVLSPAISLLGIDQSSGLSIQLDAGATAGDAVAIYGSVLNVGITNTSQLQALVELNIPNASGNGSQPVFAVPPTPFPYIYAVQTAIGGVGARTLSVSGQETSGTVSPDTGDVLNGGQPGPVTVGTTDATPLKLKSDGVDFTWPSADGLAGQSLVTDGAGTLSFVYLPVTIAQWANTTSAFAATTYYLLRWKDPEAAATVIASPTNVPMQGADYLLSSIAYEFQGNVLNVAGQTIGFTLEVDGVPVPGGTVSGLPSNSGSITKGFFQFPVAGFPAGSRVRCTVNYSAALTAGLTSINVAAGGPAGS